jgi:DNA-binding NarL/FixJ family response regulator
MKSIIKIGLAEDHGALRQGYVTLLRSHKHINVLFDVNDGKELLEKLKVVRPQILLLDLEMPVMTGQEVLKIIKSKYPKLKVIIVSGHFQRDYIVECFKLGVKAFLRKEYKIEKIVEAIEYTAETGGYIDNEVALILAGELSTINEKQKHDLTEHQIEVLKLICKGFTNKEAAETLGVSIAAIKYHRANIMERTKSETLQELISFALLNKYIDPK